MWDALDVKKKRIATQIKDALVILLDYGNVNEGIKSVV